MVHLWKIKNKPKSDLVFNVGCLTHQNLSLLDTKLLEFWNVRFYIEKNKSYYVLHIGIEFKYTPYMFSQIINKHCIHPQFRNIQCRPLLSVLSRGYIDLLKLF